MSHRQDSETPDVLKQAVLENMSTFAGSLTRAALSALARFGADHSISLDYDDLLRLASVAASSDMVRLMDAVLSSLATDEIVAILELMETKYKRMTEIKGWTTIPNTPENERLARRLKEDQVISSFDDPPTGSQFRVNLFKKTER